MSICTDMIFNSFFNAFICKSSNAFSLAFIVIGQNHCPAAYPIRAIGQCESIGRGIASLWRNMHRNGLLRPDDFFESHPAETPGRYRPLKGGCQKIHHQGDLSHTRQNRLIRKMTVKHGCVRRHLNIGMDALRRVG